MTQAAFRAVFADWKVIKTRATVQLVFEIPIEQADQAYQALGGMPIAASEVWCGIARLKLKDENNGLEQAEGPPTKTEGTSTDSDMRGVRPEQGRPAITAVPRLSGVPRAPGVDKERRAFGDIAPAQQAGIFCNEVAFHKFLQEKFRPAWMRCDDINDQRRSANVVRQLCQVDSRADIKSDNAEWLSLVLAYRLWQREPEFV